VGLSKGEYVLSDNTVRAEATFARGELTAAVPTLDPDRDGLVTEADVTNARPALAKLVEGAILVRGDRRACPGKLTGARPAAWDGLALSMEYACDAAPRRFEVRLPLLEELSHGHRHVAHLVAGALAVDEVTYRGHDTVEIIAQEEEAAAPR